MQVGTLTVLDSVISRMQYRAMGEYTYSPWHCYCAQYITKTLQLSKVGNGRLVESLIYPVIKLCQKVDVNTPLVIIHPQPYFILNVPTQHIFQQYVRILL